MAMIAMNHTALRYFAFAPFILASGSFVLGCGGRAAPSEDDQTGLEDAGKDGLVPTGDGGVADFPDAASTCLGRPGPVMIPITRADGSVYCIDSTPVTNAQFNDWVRSGPDLSHRPKECMREREIYPRDEDDRPVSHVDWCEAKAYCGWAGKQLCGVSDGRPLDREAAKDPDQNLWLYACTAGGVQDYPYGNTYEEGRCIDWSWIDGSPWNAEPMPVRSAPGCQGGFPGLFDMVGNVMEWIDAVDGDQRGLAGGAILAPPFDAICTSLEWGHFESGSTTMGFRCCKIDL